MPKIEWCEYCTDLGKYKSISSELFHQTAADEICEIDMPTNYCPACGRRLTPVEPLTLKELENMDGKPVWALSFTEEEYRWHIFEVIKNPDGSEPLLSFEDLSVTLDKEMYGKTWNVYPEKPPTNK